MSLVAVERHQQVEQITNRLVAHIQRKYPFIATEVSYDPPDNVDAWVTLHGAADTEEWDEIRHFGCEITDPAWEREGVLVLIHAGDYRTPPDYPPLDQAAIAAASEAYQKRQKADQVMAYMVQEVQRVFPQLPVDTHNGGPECEDGWVTIHVPEMVAPDGIDPQDVADSLRKLVSDRQLAEMAADPIPVHIQVTTEVDPSLNDVLLTTRLVRHYRLTELIGELYPLIHRTDPEGNIETEVAYYPPAGGDACLILHGVKDEAQMEQIRSDTHDALDTARRELSMRVSLQRGTAPGE